jgi:hypothetical protein
MLVLGSGTTRRLGQSRLVASTTVGDLVDDPTPPSLLAHNRKNHRSSDDPGDPSHRHRSLLTLVSMMEKIKRRRLSANDQYVARYLASTLRLDQKQLESFFDQHTKYFNSTLSVKRDLEPVVLFLRSLGLSDEEVSRVAAKAPLLFRRRVDDLFEIIEWLGNRFGDPKAAKAVLVKRPELFVVDSSMEDIQRRFR